MDKKEIIRKLSNHLKISETTLQEFSNFELFDKWLMMNNIDNFTEEIWNVCLCLIKDEIVS